MAEKLQTDNFDVALVHIAWELTPSVAFFKSERRDHSDVADYQRQAQYFATVLTGLLNLKGKRDAQISAKVIADAFSWQG